MVFTVTNSLMNLDTIDNVWKTMKRSLLGIVDLYMS